MHGSVHERVLFCKGARMDLGVEVGVGVQFDVRTSVTFLL